MLRKLTRLFRRYAGQHGRVIAPGFPLIDSDGIRFGHLDRIVVGGGRIGVEGWADATRVGLAAAGRTAEKVPDLARSDVGGAVQTPGFRLEIPLVPGPAVLWAERDGKRHVYLMPGLSRRKWRAMQMRQIGPFLRAGLHAAPDARRWLRDKDPAALEAIKRAFGLAQVRRTPPLDPTALTAPGDSVPAAMPAAGAPPITVVVPVYNALDMLPEALSRVIRHTDLPWRMVLVEDCSSDPQVRPWLRDWHAGLPSETREQVTLLENEANLGFIGSVNRAFGVALPLGGHVVLLNSDAFVPAGWASRLVRPLVEGASVASVTPMSNDAEIFNVPKICVRDSLAPGEADALDAAAAALISPRAQADAPTGVGFCMAMHIDWLRRVPQFDTAFGRGYGEEVDWCQRVRRLGGRHLGIGNLFVEHRGGTSFGSAEKLAMIRRNGEMIAQRYPRYDADVQDFIETDPLLTVRLALGLALEGARNAGGMAVYVAHSMGGGAQHYLAARIAAEVADGGAAVVLRVGGASRWRIELHGRLGVTSADTGDTALMQRLLAILPARRVIYSCAVGDPDPAGLPAILTGLVQGDDDRLEVLFHDYFTLSPSYTLVGSDAVFRGVPMPGEDSDAAHGMSGEDGTRTDLADWRRLWGGMLEAADRIEVFSESSRQIVRTAYPRIGNRIVVNPHKLPNPVARIPAGVSDDGVPVIGVLGNIGLHKGAAVLRDLSRALAGGGRARLVVIGNVDPAFPLTAPAIAHGSYDIADLPQLVAWHGISRWLIPSICPETFSYTTHEALATGLPVWSFALGAQGDAVAEAAAATGRGGVIPLDGGAVDPETVLAYVLGEAAPEAAPDANDSP